MYDEMSQKHMSNEYDPGMVQNMYVNIKNMIVYVVCHLDLSMSGLATDTSIVQVLTFLVLFLLFVKSFKFIVESLDTRSTCFLIRPVQLS